MTPSPPSKPQWAQRNHPIPCSKIWVPHHRMREKSASDSAAIMSNATTLSQLTEQVSKIKQLHQMMLNCFDKLAKQMTLLISNSTSSPKTCPARGNESSQATWCDSMGQYQGRSPYLHVMLFHRSHPCSSPFFLGWVTSSQGSISAWGNPLGNKPSSTFCLCFHNIGGLSQLTESNSEIKLQSISVYKYLPGRCFLHLWNKTLAGSYYHQPNTYWVLHKDGGKLHTGVSLTITWTRTEAFTNLVAVPVWLWSIPSPIIHFGLGWIHWASYGGLG